LIYYYNHHTEECSWTKPQNTEISPPPSPTCSVNFVIFVLKFFQKERQEISKEQKHQQSSLKSGNKQHQFGCSINAPPKCHQRIIKAPSKHHQSTTKAQSKYHQNSTKAPSTLIKTPAKYNHIKAPSSIYHQTTKASPKGLQSITKAPPKPHECHRSITKDH
jgi:hypothetical protein